MTEHARGGLDASELGCPHVERCPGCPLGTLPYAAGLVHKGERLEQALRRHPELDEVEPGAGVLGAASSHDYRLRAKLVADAAGQLGLFAAGTHEVVDIPGCRVQAPEVFEAAAALRALAPLEIPLRGVDLRLCDRGVLVCLIVEGKPDRAALDRVQRQVREHVPHLCGLALNVARAGSVQLLGPELEVLWGSPAEAHHLAPDGPWHFASHGAFTQVHAGQAARLHERIEAEVRTRLGGLEGKQVLELYAGSGALALRLAARGARVTAVEAFTPALDRIAQAASSQDLQVTTWAGDAAVFLHERATSSVGERVDVVLVNPPRRGLVPAVRAAIAALRPQLISYVSCEPETLARDMVHFGLLGYGASRLEAFDMIPWSDAVESLVLLAPAPPSALRVLFEDATSVALFKLPFESCVPQGGASPSLIERAREALAEPGLVPVHRLEAGTSGVCWFARRPEHVAPLARALEGGEMTYVALARGITHMKGKINRPVPAGGKPRPALTRYRRTAVVGGHSLLALHPEQVRQHQLNRHLASIGHPILGDTRHGDAASNRHFEHRHGLDRPFLHCAALRVALERGEVEIRAPLAGDLAAVLAGAGQARALAGSSGRL